LPNSALFAKSGNGGELRLSGGRKAHSLITRSGCLDRGHACENPHSACCSRARSFVNLYRPRAWPVHYTPCLNTLREVVGGWVVAVDEEGMCGRERVMVCIVTERVTSLRELRSPTPTSSICVSASAFHRSSSLVSPRSEHLWRTHVLHRACNFHHIPSTTSTPPPPPPSHYHIHPHAPAQPTFGGVRKLAESGSRMRDLAHAPRLVLVVLQVFVLTVASSLPCEKRVHVVDALMHPSVNHDIRTHP